MIAEGRRPIIPCLCYFYATFMVTYYAASKSWQALHAERLPRTLPPARALRNAGQSLDCPLAKHGSYTSTFSAKRAKDPFIFIYIIHSYSQS